MVIGAFSGKVVSDGPTSVPTMLPTCDASCVQSCVFDPAAPYLYMLACTCQPPVVPAPVAVSEAMVVPPETTAPTTGAVGLTISLMVLALLFGQLPAAMISTPRRA